MTLEGRIALTKTLSVLAIIGSVIAIAVPKYDAVQRQVASDQVLTDLEYVRNAVYTFYSDSGYFPPESPSGAMPEGLTEYLPSLFKTARPYGRIRYRNWPVVTSGVIPATSVIGLTVIPQDARIAELAARRAAPAVTFSVGGAYTFLLFGSSRAKKTARACSPGRFVLASADY